MEIPKMIISNNDLVSTSLLPVAPHDESKLYISGNWLYKILNKELRMQRESIVKELYSQKIDGITSPIYALYDKQDNFIGYVMEYLKNYHTLLSKKNSFTIEEKINIIKRICSTYKELKEKGLFFTDANIDNFMLHEMGIDVKFVDVDSIAYLKNISKNYDYQMSIGCCQLLVSCLSILFNKDIDSLPCNTSKGIIEYFAYYEDPILNELIAISFGIERILNNPIYYLDDYIDKMDVGKILTLEKRRN